MARDWRWKKATFGGASFFIDTQELQEGRRLVVHEYPGGERYDIEDMGRAATRLEITAYFVSETADTDSAAFIALLELGVPQLLSIPMFGARMFRAESWRPSWGRAVLNFVGFQVTFIEEMPAFAPVATGLGASLLGVMGSGLGFVLGSAITGNMPGQTQSNFVWADALTEAVIIAGAVSAFRAETALPERIDAEARVAALDALSLAGTPSTAPGDALAASLAVLDTVVSEATGDPLASALKLDAMATAALARRTALLGKWGVSDLVGIVPLAAAAAYSVQASRLRAIKDYRDRKAAQAERSRIAASAGAITALYDALGPDAMSALDAMFGMAAKYLSDRIPNLAPVVIVETGVSLPSNVLAYRLYGDPNRAQELVDRNAVATPAIMPTKIEALAS